MSRQSYRKFLYLIDHWPVDTTKVGGRDLGEYIRFRVKQVYKAGEASQVDDTECVAVCESLLRLANDTHKNRYPRKYHSSALRVPKEECTRALSNEGLAFMSKENQGMVSKLKGMFKGS